MRSFTALLYTEFVTFLRDKATLTFTFLFPVIFILIFGFLMRGTGTVQSTRLGLFVSPDVASETLEEVISHAGTVEVTRYESESALKSSLEERSIDFGLIWDGNTLHFLYGSSRVQENYAFEEMSRGIGSEFNLTHQGLAPVLTMERVHVGKAAAMNWFNRAVPGILAFSILSAGLFAVSGHLTAMKERKLLDRLIVTPMRPLALLAAIACVRLAVVYISTLITLGIAMSVLHQTFSVNWFYYTILVAASTFGMMGFGTVIALLVRKSSSASNIANVLSMLMMFLAGIYFPVEIMPSYLRALSKALPLTYMAEAMRFATGVADMTTARFWSITLALLATGFLLFPFLARYVVRADRR
jgi:ABC-2 type transport system permease protein